MGRSARGARAVLALGLTVLSLAVPANAAARTCGVPGAWTAGGDGWTRVDQPRLSTGGDTMTAYALDEHRPERLYVTNGLAVAASRDAGCTWTEARLPDDGLGAVASLGGEDRRVARTRLLDIQLPLFGGSTVWAVGLTDVVSGGTPLVEPRVLRSDDGARTFASRTAGLPRFASPVALRAGASPLDAYLLLDEKVPVDARSLWRTVDGGESWTRVSQVPYDDLVVDAFRRVLWAWDAGGLFVSRDLGGSWVRLRLPGTPVRVDAAPAFTTVVLAEGVRLDFVTPERSLRAPATDHVTSVAAGPELGLVAMSSVVAGVTLDPPLGIERPPVDVTPEDVTLSDLTFAQTKDDDAFVLYGFSPRALYRRSVTDAFAAPPRPKVDVQVRPARPAPPARPALRPAPGVVTLKPGEVRRVGYDLVLPPAPTPLDVYFMTDSTGSMSDAIGAVQEGVQDIVDDLTASGIDLHFGVADFRDYPRTPDNKTTYPYKRHRAVGPVDDGLALALGSLTTGGGNGDDSALEAVYQAVTGEGRTGLTASIPRGQDARFRKDALKVVLLASDEEMREPSPAEPWNAGPSKQAVIDALVEHGVEVVGIRVQTGAGDPRPQMERLARGAGSLAPAGGVDCDGDGEPDLHEGDPLVCDFADGQDSIAPAFVGMLRAIEDLADVRVGVTGPRDVVRHLGDDLFRARNVKASNTLPVPVEYRCPPARYGTDTPVVIEGVLRSRVLAAGTATVRCLAPAKVAPVLVPPPVTRQPPPRPLRAAAVPPPPPPQPNPNVNPNPNPNPQAQANAGMAAQDEQQHQLALADNDVTEDEQLAFSALDDRKAVTPAVTLLAGALVACAAAGAQLHLARRTRVATIPSRGARR